MQTEEVNFAWNVQLSSSWHLGHQILLCYDLPENVNDLQKSVKLRSSLKNTTPIKNITPILQEESKE